MANKLGRRFLLLILLTASCELDPLVVLLHPDVEQRVEESLALPPPPPLPGADTLRFAAFGDIHIGKPVGCWWQQFSAAIDTLDISLFCVAGDLTEHGTVAEFDSVAALLRQTGINYYVTIGNHDLYRLNSWELYKERFGPACYSLVLTRPGLKLIFLDTGEGRLGARQFEWLKQELARPPARQIIITHFPLYDDQTPSIFRLGSAAERAKLQSLMQRFNVFALISGHIHGFRHYRIGGVNHFTVGTISRALDFGQPGFLLFTCLPDTLYWQFVPLN
ncbi:MAG: metallophosphoesterase family protein [candidate division WOR-3 bacterium]|jgi:3',5'-cyclic AMP phosphodiesterase CpdA